MKTGSIIILTLLFWTSCEKVPDFDESPEITFNGITKVINFDPLTLVETDSITITVDFKDGDGDLGLEIDEANSGDFIGEFSKNFHVTFFKKIDGEFIDITDAGAEPLDFGGVFEKLAPTDEIAPIQGTLSHHFRLLHTNDPNFLIKGDTLRFEVYIYDKQLNKSNTITTSEIIFWED